MIKRILFILVWLLYFPIGIIGMIIGIILFLPLALFGFIIHNDDEYYMEISDNTVAFFAFLPDKIVYGKTEQ